jgi:1,6-anhydro-N-acetylmuramate kinase
MGKRVDKLVARLRGGAGSTIELLKSLSDTQWQQVLYQEPYPWTVRDMLAHLLSTEEGLARLARDVAAGGAGAPAGFEDYDHYNAEEQERLAGVSVESLLADLAATRDATTGWVATLDEADLDREGRHPALGQVPLDTLINVIHGHQLIHLRDLKALLRSLPTDE